ncbi:MAG: hypothetical protein E6J08_13740, partial [Chloroflexi bacterium]
MRLPAPLPLSRSAAPGQCRDRPAGLLYGAVRITVGTPAMGPHHLRRVRRSPHSCDCGPVPPSKADAACTCQADFRVGWHRGSGDGLRGKPRSPVGIRILAGGWSVCRRHRRSWLPICNNPLVSGPRLGSNRRRMTSKIRLAGVAWALSVSAEDRLAARRRLSEYLVPAVAGRVSTLLVGREDEIGRLTETVERVAGGQGAVVFLTGELGIGKTRLAQWTLEAARARGFQILQAGAFPLERDLPYALLIAVFKPALRRLNLGQRSVLTRDLGHLGLLFADLNQAPPQVLGDPALEKTRLFEDVSRLLEFLAA